MTEFMRSTDAFTWAMESDPRLRSTVVSVAMLDKAPDWTALRRRFDLLSRRLPIFRQRVVPSLSPAPPRWKDCHDFDLDFHIRRVSAPPPATLDTILEMARLAQMEDFDRARPLWKVTLVDGMADGGAALLCTFHHSLTDGVGGVQIAMTLFDLNEQLRPLDPLPDEPTPVITSWLGGYGDILRWEAEVAGNAVVAAAKNAPALLYNGIRRPLDTAGRAVETAASIYRTVRPVNRTGSSLMTRRSLIRRLGVHDVPTSQLREAAHRGGGALNDAFVAGVAGGLRIYHEKHGVSLHDLHISMPISLRTDQDEIGGNRITLMRFDIPVDVVDPVERIAEIHRRATRVRHERSLPLTQLIAGALNMMPRWYIGSILRHVDFVASDVPGIPVPVFLGGARVQAQYAWGPTIGAAVNITLLSYVDVCSFGINVDTGAIADFDAFRDCLVEGFNEVLALAG
ncbi:wax ester/triacylglycerol synthase domain-containing protein [Mycolicibacterium stellerae]|uniref:wax ester/triacylglycerol synthase domain-containing protein n=1 Tax=Mycolicibacterium stellerae TaxID=2358193 RepID=UPI000F0B1CE8|nr:wax ester/triacylglycerol synthase domain-containing protein [Mycolicibacterium stellerae]